ncbi:unnamed protein product [Prorocentrum cordatum]|uniref:Tyr recombinase domain-containing protein n=1 Tax=Prorocentrum cordatum TaxID=2364126 RepID=A0ABN9TP41_9DINO|nr:unnamed protein product [Polarella glacialis]
MAEAGPDDADGLLDELGSQELEEDDGGEGPAAAAAQPEPIAIEAREIYQSTGFDRAGAEQCSFAWQTLRAPQGPEQFARPRFLFSDDAHWDWWTSFPGVAAAIREGALLHICTEEPCNVDALPPNCQEVAHVRDALRLDLTTVADVYAQRLEHSPGAIWPADLLGARRGGAAAGARRLARAKPAAGGAPAPFDALLGGGLAPRGGGPTLDEPTPREELRRGLAAAKGKFEGAAPAAAAPVPAGAAEPRPAEVKPRKRGLGEVLAERAAKVARPLDAEHEAKHGSWRQLHGGDEELGCASRCRRRRCRGAGGRRGLPRGLAAKRAYCRELAQESPGRLSELTLGQMAEFLRALEGGASVDPTSALALRYLPTVYLPQKPERQIGAQMFREPRALAEAIDFLLQGKVQHALDVLTQRMKAAQAAISDGHWKAAKWLELISARDEPTTLRNEEEEMIRSIELGELKPEELTTRLRPEGRAAPRGPEQRVARLDGAPPMFMTAKAAHAKKEGAMLDLDKFAARSPACGSGLLLVSEDYPWLEAEEVKGRRAAGVTARFGTTMSGVDLAVHAVQLVAEGAWLYVVVVALNYKYCGRCSEVSAPAAYQALSGATVDYAGEQAAKALPRVLAGQAPGQPKAEHAATLDALDHVGPEVAKWLACPEKADWRDLAAHLASLGIFTAPPEDELIRVQGEPLLSQPFAVEKKGSSCCGQATTSRGAFFARRAPAARHPYMAVGRPLPGALFGRPERVAHLASAAIAMGWMLAAPAYQHIHRRLRRLPSPAGAGLPIELEWRKGDSRPIVQACSGQDAGQWQVLIDNFAALEIVEEKRARQLLGTESDLQRRARDSYRRAGVAHSSEKAHLRQLRVERRGADVDGESGRLAGPRDKLPTTAALCLATPAEDLVPWRLCVTVLGKMMVEELILRIMLLPTAATSMRSRIGGMATVSDAPEFRRGVCVSKGLRRDAELGLNACGDIAEHLGVGARLLNIPADPQRPRMASSQRIPKEIVLKVLNVLVIGLVDGIGGLAAAFSRLPVGIVAYVAAETDAKARRVVRLRWPGAIDWGDVAQVDGTLIQDLYETFNDSVDICAAGAGSPRQDLSRLNLSGGGLHGRKSSLFFEAPRIFKLLRLLFGAKLHALLENVAGMAEDNARAISECLGVAPYLIYSSVLVPCRRPRLFWLSWPLQIVPPHRVVDRGVGLEVVGDAGSALDLEWEDPGRCWRGRPRPFPARAAQPLPDWYAAGRCRASRRHRAGLRGRQVRHTAVATKGSNSSDANDARCFLLGNSFCVHVAAWASQHILLAEGALSRPPALAELVHVGECRETCGQRGALEGDAGLPDRGEARRPALHCLSRAEKGSSDIRLDCGLPYRPRGRPRSSLDPFARRWRAVLSMAWTRGRQARINARELQAALAALPRRSRKACAHGSRWPHLVDSQVAAAIATKGRSSSRRVQPAPKRWMAMCIAADMHPLIGYVMSEDSPADEPPRKLRRGWRPKRRGGRPHVTCRPRAQGAAAALKRRSLRGQTLASLRVVAATRMRSARAVQHLLRHYGVSPQEVNALDVDGEDADGLVANYLEAKWREGAGIALANNTVAGVCFTVPRLRRRLDLSWALLKAWRRAEPAARALPFTPEIVGAMAGLAADAAAFDVGCLLLISFGGLLRGGEAFALTTADVLDRGEVIVLRVSTSNTTAGKDAAEAVVIRSRVAKRMLRLVVRHRALGEPLSWRSPAQLRSALAALTRGLGLPGPFSWHSCRRGGASDVFLTSSSMEATLVAGGWASSMTARIYVEGAVADLVRVRPRDQAAAAVRHRLRLLKAFAEL